MTKKILSILFLFVLVFLIDSCSKSDFSCKYCKANDIVTSIEVTSVYHGTAYIDVSIDDPNQVLTTAFLRVFDSQGNCVGMFGQGDGLIVSGDTRQIPIYHLRQSEHFTIQLLTVPNELIQPESLVPTLIGIGEFDTSIWEIQPSYWELTVLGYSDHQVDYDLTLYSGDYYLKSATVYVYNNNQIIMFHNTYFGSGLGYDYGPSIQTLENQTISYTSFSSDSEYSLVVKMTVEKYDYSLNQYQTVTIISDPVIYTGDIS